MTILNQHKPLLTIDERIKYSQMIINPYAFGVPAFTPADLTNVFGWWDASDLSTITKDVSDRVSQIDDKIGTNDIVQATGGNQPLWLSADRNGLDVIDFVGSRWMNKTWTALTMPFTIFHVCLVPANTGSDAAMYDGSIFLSALHYRTSTADRFRAHDGLLITFLEAGIAGTWQYMTTIWSTVTNEKEMFFGGVSKVTGTSSIDTLAGINLMSDGNDVKFGNEKFGEMAIVDGLSSASDIADWHTYAKDKWGF